MQTLIWMPSRWLVHIRGLQLILHQWILDSLTERVGAPTQMLRYIIAGSCCLIPHISALGTQLAYHLQESASHYHNKTSIPCAVYSSFDEHADFYQARLYYRRFFVPTLRLQINYLTICLRYTTVHYNIALLFEVEIQVHHDVLRSKAVEAFDDEEDRDFCERDASDKKTELDQGVQHSPAFVLSGEKYQKLSR